tara:strand:- start:600 stop:1397 length:798 start_codon:yes stop_codon:yes gene_type:complete
MDIIIAIPSYNRAKELNNKTLITLKEGGIKPEQINIFVASASEELVYKYILNKENYNKIIVGELGIRNQRIFISKYFPENTNIVSCDDDIEAFLELDKCQANKFLKKIVDLNKLFNNTFELLKKHNLYLAGFVGHNNKFWLNPGYSTNLKFIIGVCHLYINRHDSDLYPSEESESKEDFEQSIKFFLKDKGVIRYNDLCLKTKYNQPGGLGIDRFERNKNAQEYLCKTYPFICKAKFRKDGTPEVNLSSFPGPLKKYLENIKIIN